jgi:hypothetical protein
VAVEAASVVPRLVVIEIEIVVSCETAGMPLIC